VLLGAALQAAAHLAVVAALEDGEHPAMAGLDLPREVDEHLRELKVVAGVELRGLVRVRVRVMTLG
jgi:hypothetical protein